MVSRGLLSYTVFQTHQGTSRGHTMKATHKGLRTRFGVCVDDIYKRAAQK